MRECERGVQSESHLGNSHLGIGKRVIWHFSIGEVIIKIDSAIDNRYSHYAALYLVPKSGISSSGLEGLGTHMVSDTFGESLNSNLNLQKRRVYWHTQRAIQKLPIKSVQLTQFTG